MDSHQAKNVDRLECLKQNFVNLSVECRERVFRRAMVDAQDNSVDVVLQDRCRAMITKFCVKATPSKVLECLQSNTNDPGIHVHLFGVALKFSIFAWLTSLLCSCNL